ncbi:MAG: CPBP family intramembrane glutamic endopeptidase [Arenicellales bacterium]
MRRVGALADIVAALALFVLVGATMSRLSVFLPEALRMPVVVVSQGLAVLVGMALLFAWRAQRWSDIALVGLRARDGLRALLAFAACLVVNLLFTYALHGAFPHTVEAHSQQLESIARQLSYGVSLPGLLLVIGFVGVYEELFARGLLLQRCRVLMGGSWGPVLVSSVLFGLGHLYQGWVGVGQTTLIGLVLAVLTLRWKTLWPAILAHAMLDTASILALRSLGGGV